MLLLIVLALFLGLGLIPAGRVTAQTFTTLYSFTDLKEGAPRASLILSSNTLYGTAEGGKVSSSSVNGTVFAINTDGNGFTILHTFPAVGASATNSDGASPEPGLILSGNTLYGTATYGGSADDGMVFAVNTNGTGFINLHSFTAVSGPYPYTNSDGAYPDAGLILSGNTLYGTAAFGGSWGHGTVFAVNTDGGGLTVLHNFTGGIDGANPVGDLILSGNTLYGTTRYGGSSGFGTAFSLPLPPLPPVAKCKNVTVSADANCSADASIDDGSFSPNAGGTISLVQSPSGPYLLGDTSVTLTVTDNHGASNSCVATVTVLDTTPCLIALVQSLRLPSGTANSLIVKLQAAASALDRGNIQAACGSLSAFLNEVNAQEGKKLTAAQADLLKAEATRIRAVLGCS